MTLNKKPKPTTHLKKKFNCYPNGTRILGGKKNPLKVPQKNFQEGFHFKLLAKNKTQQFCEFVLINSVTIKHYRDPKDSSNITHSTIQILRVLTRDGKTDWPGPFLAGKNGLGRAVIVRTS